MEEEGAKGKEREVEVSEVKEGGKGKEVLVMDTPERSRNQIATPISKFEESPVFNFLNNLSPIKPVKSVHITQTLNALSFASLPSVFTSPHVSCQKESRFLRRHQLVDPSKPEFSSDSGNKTDAQEGYTNVAPNSNDQQENIDPGNSLGEVSEEQSYDCSKLAVELVHTLNYESTLISSSKTSCPAESKCVPEFTSTSGALIPFGQAVPGKGLFGNGVSMEGMNKTNQSGEATGCDWENLISDAADLLIFDSPEDVGAAKKLLDPATGLYSHITDGMQNIQMLGPVEQGDRNETENPSSQPGEGSYLKEFSEIQDMLAGSSLDNNCENGGLSEKTDSEPVSHLYRGMRRRCLVFEMAGTRRKHFDENPSSVSPILIQDRNTPSCDKQLLPMRTGKDSSRRVLPGIGLHLNALATAPKEYKVVKQDASVSGRLVITPSSTANFHSSTTCQETVNQSLALISMERDMEPIENGVPLLEDASQASVQTVTEEFNQSSPKKKRRRAEQAGESEGCKRCNCKKSKCLKLYCECFAAGVYCVEPCSCQECFNKPIHEDTVLATRKQIESRNPLAFAPKVIRSSDSLAEAGQDDSTKTPASARHKRGCNCKKSGCLKKYCECYQGGVGCSISCRCEGCKNAFGRKDGSVFIGTEAELEEDETEVLEKSVKERTSHKTATQNDVEQNPESAPPATPFRFARPSVHPFSSKKKPPRSSLPSTGTSSLYASQAKTTFLPPPQPKFDKHFETVMEDEMPEILQGNGSPITGIKSASPNSKRVSPPHCDFRMSPGRRSSRKLILQSIPAFPSLTPKH